MRKESSKEGDGKPGTRSTTGRTLAFDGGALWRSTGCLSQLQAGRKRALLEGPGGGDKQILAMFGRIEVHGGELNRILGHHILEGEFSWHGDAAKYSKDGKESDVQSTF